MYSSSLIKEMKSVHKRIVSHKLYILEVISHVIAVVINHAVDYSITFIVGRFLYRQYGASECTHNIILYNPIVQNRISCLGIV